MAINLRGYQEEALSAIHKFWREGKKKLLVAMPTGCGKTIVFLFVIWGARSNGLRSLIIVNTDVLVEQTVQKLRSVGIEPGVVKAARNEWSRDVVVASVQTLCKTRRLFQLPRDYFGLVIVDECHYANAISYQKVIWYLAGSWQLGVTATPFRGDKQTLANAGWDAVAYVYTIQDAVKDKWLCPFRFEQVNTSVVLDKLRPRKDKLSGETDFNPEELQRTINTAERNDAIVKASIDLLVVPDENGRSRMRKTVVFCAGVEHTVDLANAFRRNGIEAFPIYGSMPDKHRHVCLRGHRLGRYPVITNCNILTHGYDDPGIEAIVTARPTHSKVLYVQMTGRGLRPSPDTGKTDCVILGVVDIVKKHSLTISGELIALEEAIGQKETGAPLDSLPFRV